MKKMKVAYMTDVQKIEIRESQIPEPGDNEVLIRLTNVGICGSDVHYYSDGRIGDAVCEFPFILGHEPSGVVTKLGKNVKDIKEGDKVVIDPATPCNVCRFCREGRHNICPNVRFLGTPPIPGAFREYICMDRDSIFPVHKDFDLEMAALVEPLAIGVYSVNFSKIQAGDIIGVFGCGPIGLVTIAVARISGAAKIYASDPIEARREMAKRLGADVVLDPKEEDVVKRITEETEGGVDISFEACGEKDAVFDAIESIRPGGQMMLIGIPPTDTLSFEPHRARRKEIDIQIVRRSNHSVERSIRLIENKRLDISCLVTHRFPLEKLQEGIETVKSYKDGVVKAMIVMENSE